MINKLYQKTKGLVKALPLILTLGLTSPAITQAKENTYGYISASGVYNHFADDVLESTFGNAYGASISGAINLGIPYIKLGAEIEILTNKATNYEEIRRFLHESSLEERLSMVGFGPFLELSTSGKVWEAFAKLKRMNYNVNEIIKEYERYFTGESERVDGDNDNIVGYDFELGARVHLDHFFPNHPLSIKAIWEIRNTPVIKGESIKIGADFNF